MLTIRNLAALEIQIPFRFVFTHALAARSAGHGVVVTATDSEGRTGFGECVPRSYVTGETPESVVAALGTALARPFVGCRFASFEELVDALAAAAVGLPRDRHAAFCALELALLDLGGRVFGRSVGDVVGKRVADSVDYSGVVSAESLEASLKALEGVRRLKLSRVKLKVGLAPEADLELVRTARTLLGPDVGLRIDANCAWTADEALRRIEELLPFGLESVEQPLAGDDLEGLVHLTARSPVPIMVDESLASVADAETLIARRGCHFFNIRISKCGGLLNAVRIRDLGARAGIRCQLGAQVGETAILSAAGRHFAARTPGLLFAEGSYGTILLEADVATKDITLPPGGRAPVLDGPGLGIDVDPARLESYTTAHHELGGA